MILTVNIGNTHITIAGYEHDTLQFSGRLHSSPAATVDEYAMNLLNLLSLYQVAPEWIEGGILGSVVPALTGRVLGALRMLCSARFLTVGPGLKSGIKLRLDNPAQLGAELLCGAVAALEEGPGPLAVISADTAISIMAVNGKQELVGGVILPGPQLSLSALVQKTAQLPQIDLSAPASSSILGKNTSLLTERFCAGHRRAAGWAGRALSGRAWPGYPLLCHRQPAPHHPGGLPHTDRIPRVSDHGRTLPHLATKPEGWLRSCGTPFPKITKNPNLSSHREKIRIFFVWCDREDSNLWPSGSEPNALSS